MAILHKAIYRFNSIPIKTTMTDFKELEQIILKFIQSHKRPWIAKAILRQKNKAGGIIFLGFRLYYKVTVIKTTWCWHKNTHRSMEKNIEPRNNPTHLWSINLQIRRQEYIMEKRQSLQNMVLELKRWYTWQSFTTATCKRMKLEYFLMSYTKINSKWINDLNVRPGTIKLLEENIGRTLFDINHSNILLICLLRQRKQKQK